MKPHFLKYCQVWLVCQHRDHLLVRGMGLTPRDAWNDYLRVCQP